MPDSNDNPGLAPLQFNGGPTQTMAELPGSLALGAGVTAGVTVTTDQRGFPRFSNTKIDIGAYQYQSQYFITTALPAGVVNSSYSQSVAASGSTASYSGGPVDGLTLSSARWQEGDSVINGVQNFPLSSASEVGVGLITVHGPASFNNFTAIARGGALDAVPGYLHPRQPDQPWRSLVRGTDPDRQRQLHADRSGGGFTISGNQAVAEAGVNSFATLYGILLTTVDESLTIAGDGTSGSGLLARWNNSTQTGYRAVMQASGVIAIQLVQNGSVTNTLATIGGQPTTGTLRFVVSGTSLKVYLNGSGSPLLSAVNSTIPGAGAVGMQSLTGGSAFTNYIVSGS